MGGQTEGLSGDAAVVILPAILPVGGEGAVPLVAAAVLYEGLGHQQGSAADDGGVVGPGQAVFRSDSLPHSGVFNGQITADLGVFPTGSVGSQMGYQILPHRAGYHSLLCPENP